MNETENYILASLLVGVYDVNRNELLPEDNFELIRKWYDSVVNLRLKAVIFHNTFSENTISLYSNEYVRFQNVSYNKKFNPNVYRYFIYQQFIANHIAEINNVFVTDITDVELIQNPFIADYYLRHPAAIFCGDEPEILNNQWLNDHNTHLRNVVPGFTNFEKLHQNDVLLNCGIIGGNSNILKNLLDEIVLMHNTYSASNTTPFTMDMGIFNYVVRTKFNDRCLHGSPVNTVFKKYEANRTDCWFRHK